MYMLKSTKFNTYKIFIGIYRFQKELFFRFLPREPLHLLAGVSIISIISYLYFLANLKKK